MLFLITDCTQHCKDLISLGGLTPISYDEIDEGTI
jgi:hypothetical protein